ADVGVGRDREEVAPEIAVDLGPAVAERVHREAETRPPLIPRGVEGPAVQVPVLEPVVAQAQLERHAVIEQAPGDRDIAALALPLEAAAVDEGALPYIVGRARRADQELLIGPARIAGAALGIEAVSVISEADVMRTPQVEI